MKRQGIYEKIVLSKGDRNPLFYNQDADEYDRGLNPRAGAYIGVDGWYCYRINPEIGESLVIRRAYGGIGLGGLGIQAGKDSMWWGTGYHGSLLLSNNARPLTALRVLPTKTLSLWGMPISFSVFAARLERQRDDVPKPYIWGMAIVFKPLKYIEFGLDRTALLGGEGREEDVDTWWRSLTAQGENNNTKEAGDQRAGGNIKITLPFKAQPLQIYAETAGEDEAGGYPSKMAYIAGLYLPKTPISERTDLRVEYAKTSDVWYRHHIYHSGYRYHGEIIGHHMGADSEDLFIRVGYRAKKASIYMYYDREVYSDSESRDEFSVGGTNDIDSAFNFWWRAQFSEKENALGLGIEVYF